MTNSSAPGPCGSRPASSIRFCTGFDRGDAQPAGHEDSGELAGAASDLEHPVAGRQAAELAGALDELVRVGRPPAVVFDGHRVEHGAEAALVESLRPLSSPNLSPPPDGTGISRFPAAHEPLARDPRYDHDRSRSVAMGSRWESGADPPL